MIFEGLSPLPVSVRRGRSAGPADDQRHRDGRWHAAMFGNDRTAPFRAMPGFVPVNLVDSGDDLIIEPASK